MSVASKVFFGFSMLATGGTIWAVHHMQQQESEVSKQTPLSEPAKVRNKVPVCVDALDVPLKLW